MEFGRQTNMLLQKKFQLLKDNIKKRGSAVIAFSGGV